jgi:hypothetical protein
MRTASGAGGKIIECLFTIFALITLATTVFSMTDDILSFCNTDDAAHKAP